MTTIDQYLRYQSRLVRKTVPALITLPRSPLILFSSSIEERGYDISQGTRRQINGLLEEIDLNTQFDKFHSDLIEELDDINTQELELHRVDKKISLNKELMGHPISKWIDRVKQTTKDRFISVLRQAIAERASASQITSRLAGTRNAKYKDSVLAPTWRQLDTIARTAIAAESTHTRAQLIAGDIRYLTLLDSSTSKHCSTLSNKIYRRAEGPRPPRHWRCRSFIVPAELTPPESYNAWLKAQSKEILEEALGRKGASRFAKQR